MKNQQYIFILLFASILSIIFNACSKEENGGCITSTGKIIYEERLLPTSPDTLIIQGEMDVYITMDRKPRLYLQSGENLLPGTVSSLKGETLRLEDFNTCDFLRDLGVKTKVFLTITPQSFLFVEFESSGLIRSTNTLSLDSLRMECRNGGGSVNLDIKTAKAWFVQHSGTGSVDFHIRGESGYTFVYCKGYGPFDLRDLRTTGYLHFVHLGSNNCWVNASGILQAEIWSIGDLYYMGSPSTIWLKGEGSGRLIPFTSILFE